jgi:hypothetical protein
MPLEGDSKAKEAFHTAWTLCVYILGTRGETINNLSKS